MSCENHISQLLHKYLDGDATEEEKRILYTHVDTCSDCKAHFQELKRAIAFVQSSSHISAPNDFTAQVMGNLPVRKKRVKWERWMRKHPLLVAATLFLLLMSSSVFSTWNNANELTVTGSGNFQIDKETGTVLVPEGEVIEGDLVIRNGKLEVAGEVKGNVLLVNSEQYLASAGSISGEIEEVNQVLDWIWYQTKNFFSEVINFSD